MRPTSQPSSFTINVDIATGQRYRKGQHIMYGGQFMVVVDIFPITKGGGALITGYAVTLRRP